MKIYRSSTLKLEHRGGVVVIGNFDGVHLGHMELLKAARSYADAHQCPMGVLTFEPHPRLHFSRNTDDATFLLTPDHLRTDIFAGFGFDFVVLHPFNEDFTSLKYLHFIERILLEDMGVAAIVVGEDFGFGQNREGGVAQLRNREEFDTVTVAEVFDDIQGVAYSSTKIRSLLVEGKTVAANIMMGAAFTVAGQVFRNEQTGKELGFPTANIRSMAHQVQPKLGVYAGRVMLSDGRVFDAAINWGLRPSVKNRGLMYEAHLFDFDEDLYDQTIRIALLDYIRPEVKFAGTDALRAQIAADCVQVKTLLANVPRQSSMGEPISITRRNAPIMNAVQRTKIEAATFRRMVRHLQNNPEVQNIDLMLLADFCRNCLSKWYEAAAHDQGITLDKTAAREIIYGEPYADWKAKHQTEANPEKMTQLATAQAAKKAKKSS